jgi:hypothetical protein
MSRYHAVQLEEDLGNLKNALQYLDQIRENFGDVLAIPEVVTIQDVMAIALDTTKGPQLIGDVCSRDEIVHILRAFVDNPCGDPALIAQYALNDYRETRPINKE